MAESTMCLKSDCTGLPCEDVCRDSDQCLLIGLTSLVGWDFWEEGGSSFTIEGEESQMKRSAADTGQLGKPTEREITKKNQVGLPADGANYCGQVYLRLL